MADSTKKTSDKTDKATKVVDEGKLKALGLAIEQIDKQFGTGSIMKLGDSHRADVELISSGALSLDLALGGGYPKGRILEIYGPESSGKTTLSLHAIAEVQRQGGTAAFIDAEHALDPSYARRLGVDTDNLLVSQPDNQIRMKIGVMFGNPETTTGGNALKFYASVRLDIRRTGQIKVGEEVIGNRTKVKVVKNKIAPPFRVAEFDIMYNEGISRTGDVLDLAVIHGIVGKAGAWFDYKDGKIGQGREATKVYLKENPKVLSEIEKAVRDKVVTQEV